MPGALGTGGPTIVVNGMEVSSLNVTASAVQQIRINQDPYGAEYSRPGRGRIEILTKPGSQEYEGELNLTARAGRFNARNAFADSRSTEQRQIVEGTMGGPVGHGGKTSFLLSTEIDAENQQATVLATTLQGRVVDAITQPNRNVDLSGSITRQLSNANTFSIRPAYGYESVENGGVGGTTLRSAATIFKHHEAQVTYMQQSILSPALLNQFQLLVGEEREPTTSVSSAQGVVVNGAFTAGGAQRDLVRTERHFQLNEGVAWTTKAHFVQAGCRFPTGAAAGSTTAAISAARFTFQTSTRSRKGGPTRLSSSKATA